MARAIYPLLALYLLTQLVLLPAVARERRAAEHRSAVVVDSLKVSTHGAPFDRHHRR